MVGYQESRNSNARRSSRTELLPVFLRLLWALIVVCGLLTLGFTFYPEWTRLAGMRSDLAANKEKLAAAKKACLDYEQEINLLQNDREYLEMIARDKLDLMKEGETIFRFPKEQHKS